ncbi:MAG: hypothetical protein LBR06_06770 [Bacteroidales bacterium]|nr:hypothetical protein [Bacteroidales bacterium]
MALRLESSPWILLLDGQKSSFVANPYRNVAASAAKIVEFLRQKNVTCIYCGGVSQEMQRLLDASRIQSVLVFGDKVSLKYYVNIATGSKTADSPTNAD